jgi:hypothetical protein
MKTLENVTCQKRFFGVTRTENTISKAHRCYDGRNSAKSCGGTNVSIRKVRKTDMHIFYNVLCNDCMYTQRLTIRRYKINNFLKV